MLQFIFAIPNYYFFFGCKKRTLLFKNGDKSQIQNFKKQAQMTHCVPVKDPTFLSVIVSTFFSHTLTGKRAQIKIVLIKSFMAPVCEI